MEEGKPLLQQDPNAIPASSLPPPYSPTPQEGHVGGQYPPQAGTPYPPQAGSPYPPQYHPQSYGQPYPSTAPYQYSAPGYPQGPMGVPQGPILAQDVRFRESPVVCTCPYCGATGPTITEYVNGLMTWLSMGGLVLIGCWLGCCLIPLGIDACKDVEHKCPSCQRTVGVYRRVN